MQLWDPRTDIHEWTLRNARLEKGEKHLYFIWANATKRATPNRAKRGQKRKAFGHTKNRNMMHSKMDKIGLTYDLQPRVF